MRALSLLASVVVCSVVVGCGAAPAPPPAPPPPGGGPIAPEAVDAFQTGLRELARHDAAHDWTLESCRATEELFRGAAAKQKTSAFPQALYDAGLAALRCGDKPNAEKDFTAVLAADPKHHRAKTELALLRLDAAGDKGLDEAIKRIEEAVLDASFKDADALVSLAMLEQRRGTDADLEKARENLQRALAVDDASMPAYNQLALRQLEVARRAGKDHKANSQGLDLAELICSQAIRKNASYAPIHNTAGLIQVERGSFTNAATEFNEARRIDPFFFEAHVNAAALNLQFRGYKPAEQAYRAALRIRPDDYESQLGLALALRAQIDDVNAVEMLKKTEDALATARKLAPDRAETDYNEAVLVEEYKAKTSGPEAKQQLVRARGLFQKFLEKASNSPKLAPYAERARAHIADIDEISNFADKPAQ